mgnify:CR=1 FL=1
MNAPVAHPMLHHWPVTTLDTLHQALWTAAEIASATGGIASHDFQASGVEMDSRDVKPGDVFVALKGEAMDGHRFIDAAFAKGAVAAITDRPVDYPHVLVEDTTAALHALAHAARDRAIEAVRIGITGSVGKTGVKEAIFACLDRASRGAAHRSVRSYNNHVGVPLSLARMPARAKFGVFEMGMNHAGELTELTRMVRPHVAIVTTIAPAHMDSPFELRLPCSERVSTPLLTTCVGRPLPMTPSCPASDSVTATMALAWLSTWRSQRRARAWSYRASSRSAAGHLP